MVMQQTERALRLVNGPPDPLSIPTVQAAIEQADRMARLEEGQHATEAELRRIREDFGNQLAAILRETQKTNGSVSDAIRDRERDRRRIVALEEKYGQSLSLATDASADVAAIGAELDAFKKARGDGELVSKTRWDFVKAQVRVVSLALGLAAGVSGREIVVKLLELLR